MVQPGQQFAVASPGAKTAGIADIFPGMRTDIVLGMKPQRDGGSSSIPSSTRYIVSSGWYREETLRSGYIYQIYTYLRSQEGEPAADTAEGLLLHPSVGGEIVDEAVHLQGHVIQFSTVDLLPSGQQNSRAITGRGRGWN